MHIEMHVLARYLVSIVVAHPYPWTYLFQLFSDELFWESRCGEKLSIIGFTCGGRWMSRYGLGFRKWRITPIVTTRRILHSHWFGQFPQKWFSHKRTEKRSVWRPEADSDGQNPARRRNKHASSAHFLLDFGFLPMTFAFPSVPFNAILLVHCFLFQNKWEQVWLLIHYSGLDIWAIYVCVCPSGPLFIPHSPMLY